MSPTEPRAAAARRCHTSCCSSRGSRWGPCRGRSGPRTEDPSGTPRPGSVGPAIPGYCHPDPGDRGERHREVRHSPVDEQRDAVGGGQEHVAVAITVRSRVGARADDLFPRRPVERRDRCQRRSHPPSGACCRRAHRPTRALAGIGGDTAVTTSASTSSSILRIRSPLQGSSRSAARVDRRVRLPVH